MPRGGTREHRRKEAIVRRLDAGELPSTFAQETLDRYPELFAPYLGGAELLDYPTSPTTSPSRSRSPARLAVSLHPQAIALDLHGVLDQGLRYNPHRPVPDSTIAAIHKLREFRFVPWILSWIGTQGANSSKRRGQAQRTREYIASQLGLDLSPGSEPHPDRIFLKISDFRTGEQGKAHFCGQLGTFILLDDNPEICQDCESCGVLAFQICGGRTRRRYIPRNWIDPRARQFTDFPTAVDHICALLGPQGPAPQLQLALEQCWLGRDLRHPGTLTELTVQ